MCDYYLKLSSAVPKTTKIILDTSGNKMIAGLRGGAYLIKPNLDELQEMTGEHYDSFDEMITGCEKLIEAGAENVMLSLGRKGAILTDGDKAYFCKSATVAVNSTVGAGDGFAVGDRLHAVVIDDGDFPEAAHPLSVQERFERAIYMTHRHNIVSVWSDGREVVRR